MLVMLADARVGGYYLCLVQNREGRAGFVIGLSNLFEMVFEARWWVEMGWDSCEREAWGGKPQ